MKWVRENAIFQIARGKKGTFFVEKSGGLWWGKYRSPRKDFNLPPHRLLKVAKYMCESNVFWEKEPE